MDWYVLCVKPRCEKVAVKKLQDLNVEIYCPRIKEIKQWSDRKKVIETPLFKSYVFVKLNEKNRNIVFDVPEVTRYLFWLGKPAIVRNDEIEIIKDWISDEKVESITLSNPKLGDEVIMKKGILKGQKATIQRIGKTDLRLIANSLGVVVYAKLKEVS